MADTLAGEGLWLLSSFRQGTFVRNAREIEHSGLPTKVPLHPYVHANFRALFDWQASMEQPAISHAAWLQVDPKQSISLLGLERYAAFGRGHQMVEGCQLSLICHGGDAWKVRPSSHAVIFQI